MLWIVSVKQITRSDKVHIWCVRGFNGKIKFENTWSISFFNPMQHLKVKRASEEREREREGEQKQWRDKHSLTLSQFALRDWAELGPRDDETRKRKKNASAGAATAAAAHRAGRHRVQGYGHDRVIPVFLFLSRSNTSVFYLHISCAVAPCFTVTRKWQTEERRTRNDRKKERVITGINGASAHLPGRNCNGE